MQATVPNSVTPMARDKVRNYFRDVIDNRKLPSLPLVVAKVLNLINDGDVTTHRLARVVSDDPALAGRVLALARSAHYAQRRAASTLPEAIQVIGFKTLRVLVIATATQGLLLADSGVSKKLWSHSVATALAARQIALEFGYADHEEAYLAGLLHDVGQMILHLGDRQGFERLTKQFETEPGFWMAREIEAYEMDHAAMGRSLLNAWEIGGDIGAAIFSHHEMADPRRLAILPTVIQLADYLSTVAGLGFFAAPAAVGEEALTATGWHDQACLKKAAEDLIAEFGRENLLLMGH